MKGLKTAGNDVVKAVKGALKSASSDYGAGAIDADTAITQAVTAITAQRDTLEDAAFATAVAIAAAGSALLSPPVDGALLDPPRDFQAGGGGVWDDAQNDVEALLDKIDGKLDKEFVKFMGAMDKAAKKLGDPLVIHYRLPPHGEGFWTVESPGASEGAGDGPDAVIDVEPAQVLIAVRFVDVSNEDWACFGVRGFGTDFDLNISTRFDEDVKIPDIPFDQPSGTAITMQPMDGLLNTSFANVRLQFEALEGADAAITLSAPRVVTIPPEVAALAKDLQKNGKKESGFFNKVGGQIVSQLGKDLKSHEKAYASGDVDAYTALHTGWCNLEGARSDIGFWRGATTAATIDGVQAELIVLVTPDLTMPGAFKSDACGIYADIVKKFQKTEARRQTQITQKFEKFAAKIVKLAGKQGDTIATSFVVGRNRPVDLPQITTAGVQAATQAIVEPHLSDVILFNDGGAGADLPPAGLEGSLIGIGPALTTIETSVTSPAEGTLVIHGLVTDTTGVDKQESLPFLGDIPFLGRFFRGGPSQDKRTSLIFLVSPSLVGTTAE